MKNRPVTNHSGCNELKTVALITRSLHYSRERRSSDWDQCFALAACLYGRFIDRDEIMSAREDNESRRKWNYLSFDGFGIDTSSNRSYVIGMRQYHAYGQTFSLSHSMLPTENRAITDIVGMSKQTDVDITQVPFEKLSLYFDVALSVLKEKITKFISIK